MSETKQSKLGERELDIMSALWRLGRGTVRDVHEAMSAQGIDVAYTTVQTMLNRLQAKGYVDRRMTGRAYLYSPRVRRPAAAGKALDSLIDRFFGGSSEQLARHLIESDLSAAELDRVRSLLERRRKGAG